MLHQTRVGRDGRAFAMLKFRSMVENPPEWDPKELQLDPVVGPFPKLKNDPRVTPVGRVIRRTSIDELPQLWNVLRGQMSLVGPRPFIPEDAAWIDGWAEQRYSVRPGMTGLWQVSGRNDLLFEDMCRLDHLYVSSWSLGLDMRIFLQTLRAVTQGRGAY
jgi:lipopolysaccharide/colanic/teichoic acid biosynthesis glycosyltransferase